MDVSLQVTDVSHVIQLAVAPVFLLAGISGMLSVLSLRLGRIVDRARRLDELLSNADQKLRASIHAEHRILSHRSKLANRAISLCTLCALLICTVIVVLFIGAFFALDISAAIAFLFVSAMIVLISALLIFLREIYLATRSLRIGQN